MHMSKVGFYYCFTIWKLDQQNSTVFLHPYLLLCRSLVAQLVKNPPAMQEDPWVGKIPWRRERLPTPVFWPREFHGLPMGSQRVGHDWATLTSLVQIHISCIWLTLMIMYSLVTFFFPTTFVNEACSCTK